jgi:hypothetical protein
METVVKEAAEAIDSAAADDPLPVTN